MDVEGAETERVRSLRAAAMRGDSTRPLGMPGFAGLVARMWARVPMGRKRGMNTEVPRSRNRALPVPASRNREHECQVPRSGYQVPKCRNRCLGLGTANGQPKVRRT